MNFLRTIFCISQNLLENLTINLSYKYLIVVERSLVMVSTL